MAGTGPDIFAASRRSAASPRVAGERRTCIPRLSHAPDDSSTFIATSCEIRNRIAVEL
jgi:hypothetical protein